MRHAISIMVPAVAIIATIAVASLLVDVRIPTLTRDMASLANIHPLTGALSNLGILLWCVASTVSLFAAWTLRRASERCLLRFLVASGALSAYFMVDDLFLVHDYLIPHHVGLWEKAVYLGIASATAAYLYAFRHYILQSHKMLLGIAVILLALSMSIDAVFASYLHRIGDWHVFLEDGLKWMGITYWLGFHALAARDALSPPEANPQR